MKKLFMTMLLAVAMVMPMSIKASTEIEPVTVRKENVVAGEIIEVDFPYEIKVEDFKLEGITYMGYTKPTHRFRVDKDMQEVVIRMTAQMVSGADRENHEDGEGNHIGKPGEGSGDVVDWTGFALGKHGWTLEDGRIMYAIRLDVKKYEQFEHIFVQDISTNLNELDLGGVRVIVPNSEGKAETIRETPSELIQDEDGEFTLKITVPKMDEHEEMRLDIVYYMKATGEGTPTNKYQVYTLEEWEKIISEGSGSGEELELPPVEEDKEVPVEPEDKPVDKEEKEETPEKETEEKPSEPSEPDTGDSEVIKEEEVETPKEEVKKPEQAPKEPLEKEESSSVATEPTKEVLPPTGMGNHLTAISTLVVALGVIILVITNKK